MTSTTAPQTKAQLTQRLRTVSKKIAAADALREERVQIVSQLREPGPDQGQWHEIEAAAGRPRNTLISEAATRGVKFPSQAQRRS